MANTKDAYQKWKESGVLESKLKLIIDLYAGLQAHDSSDVL